MRQLKLLPTILVKIEIEVEITIIRK